MWDLFVLQNKKCALTGVDLVLPKRHGDTNGNASLDRIDSSKGYIENNLQWLHKDINNIKLNFDEDYFIKMCSMVANYNKGKDEQ